MSAEKRAEGPPRGRAPPRQLVGMASLAGAVFAVTTVIVVRANGPTGADRALTSFVARHRVSWVTTLMKGLTWLGSTPVVEVVALAGAVMLTIGLARWIPAGKLLASMAGAIALKDAVKALIDQPRPPVALRLVDVSGPSFPSGHVVQTVATYGMLAIVLGVGLARPVRVALWAVAAGLSLLMAVSRVYLGVHWLTDTVGGLALGGLWLAAVQMVDWAVQGPRYSGPERRAGPA